MIINRDMLPDEVFHRQQFGKHGFPSHNSSMFILEWAFYVQPDRWELYMDLKKSESDPDGIKAQRQHQMPKTNAKMITYPTAN